MKRIVSVSIGSSKRDHRAEIAFLGEKIIVERIGTDGDMDKAIQLIRTLDGQVDAFGMGGIDLYIWAGGRCYAFREAKKIAAAARKTPIVDGSGLKNTLERRVIRFLHENGIISFSGKKVLMVSAVDRFGMAEALDELGADIVFGDLIFGLGVPIALRSLGALRTAAYFLAPIVTQLPFKWLYPTGDKQEKSVPKYGEYYRWADIIAGDYHFSRRYMPARIDDKIIVTNTVTRSDIEDLRARGASLLVSTTPNIEGRSFGTNVMEALIVAMAGKKPEDMTVDDYLEWLDKMKFEPRIERLDSRDKENQEVK